MKTSNRLQLKQQSIIVFLLMILVCCLVDAKAEPQVGKTSYVHSVPDFKLQDMQGDGHQLRDYAGKTVIVNFWAVWCAPCRKEIPAMNRALAILKDENIAMLGINVGDPQKAIEAFSESYPMDFTVLMDKDGVVSQHWQVAGFPTTFLVDPDGKIVYRIVGGREWDEDTMLDSVRSIAANQVKKSNTTKF